MSQQDIRDKLISVFEQARQSPDVKKKLVAIGQAVSTDSVDEVSATLRKEAQQWQELIKERKIKFGQ